MAVVSSNIRNNICACVQTRLWWVTGGTQRSEGWRPTPGPDDADMRDVYSEALGILALHNNQSKCEQCVYCALFFYWSTSSRYVICLLERVLRIPLNVLYFVFLFPRCLVSLYIDIYRYLYLYINKKTLLLFQSVRRLVLFPCSFETSLSDRLLNWS